MPHLSDTMTEGVVSTWHKKVGDTVKSGDILADIETDKATMEFESYYDGVLLHIGVPAGKAAPVDSLLAIIGKKGEDISGLLKESEAPKAQEKKEAKAEKEAKEAKGDKVVEEEKAAADGAGPSQGQATDKAASSTATAAPAPIPAFASMRNAAYILRSVRHDNKAITSRLNCVLSPD